MADTARGDFQDVVCSDCGEKGCAFVHNGPLVPVGTSGHFCWFCWLNRQEWFEDHDSCLPLGNQPPGIPEEFSSDITEVKTESGSTYFLFKTCRENERIVFKAGKELDFRRARVICLRIGKGLWLRPRDSDDHDLFCTHLVTEINKRATLPDL